MSGFLVISGLSPRPLFKHSASEPTRNIYIKYRRGVWQTRSHPEKVFLRGDVGGGGGGGRGGRGGWEGVRSTWCRAPSFGHIVLRAIPLCSVAYNIIHLTSSYYYLVRLIIISPHGRWRRAFSTSLSSHKRPIWTRPRFCRPNHQIRQVFSPVLDIAYFTSSQSIFGTFPLPKRHRTPSPRARSTRAQGLSRERPLIRHQDW